MDRTSPGIHRKGSTNRRRLPDAFSESRPRDIASQIENYQARKRSFFCLYEETIKAILVFKNPFVEHIITLYCH